MPKSNSEGFTIIELMIVVLVLGVIAALALPSFKSILDGRKLKGAADELYAMLQFARSESIKQNQAIYFDIDVANWCFGVDDAGADCDCTNPSSCTISGQNKVVDDSDAAPVLISSATVNNITFNTPNAIPDSSGTFTLALPDGRTKEIRVNAIGLVSLVD